MGYMWAGCIACMRTMAHARWVGKIIMSLVVCSHEPNDDENQEECMRRFASRSTQIKNIKTDF